MNPFNLIPLPYQLIAKLAVTALLGLVIFVSGYYHGYESEKQAYDTLKAGTDANAKIAEQHAINVKSDQQEITKNVQSSWIKNANALHDYYKSHPNVVRVCNSAPSGNVPIIPATAKGVVPDSAGESGTVEAAAAAPSEGLSVNLELVGSGLLKLLKKSEWTDEQSMVK